MLVEKQKMKHFIAAPIVASIAIGISLSLIIFTRKGRTANRLKMFIPDLKADS